MTSVLALGGEPYHVRACLLEPVAGQYRLIGWEETVFDSQRGDLANMPEEMARLSTLLGNQLGRPLWDAGLNQPYQEEEASRLGLSLDHVSIVVNPLPPMRVWLAGLSTGESLAAGSEAVGRAPTTIVAAFCLEHGVSAAEIAAELQESRPDVAVIVGGYETTPTREDAPVLKLVAFLGEALSMLPESQRPEIFYAGSALLVEEAKQQLAEKGLSIRTAANVLPISGRPVLAPLAAALNQHYWARSLETPWIQTLARWTTSPAQLRTVDWAFSQAVKAWMMAEDLPELHGLYCGLSQWIHVWARQEQDGIQVRFVAPESQAASLQDWPPVQLVSGAWPMESMDHSQKIWRDPLGLTPVIASAGQLDPLIPLQIMANDLLLD